MMIYLSKMVIFHSCHSYVCYVKRPEGDSTLFPKRPNLQAAAGLGQSISSTSSKSTSNPWMGLELSWLSCLAAWISWMLPWSLGQAGLTSRQRSSNKWLDFQIRHLKYLKSQFSKAIGTNGDFSQNLYLKYRKSPHFHGIPTAHRIRQLVGNFQYIVDDFKVKRHVGRSEEPEIVPFDGDGWLPP